MRVLPVTKGSIITCMLCVACLSVPMACQRQEAEDRDLSKTDEFEIELRENPLIFTDGESTVGIGVRGARDYAYGAIAGGAEIYAIYATTSDPVVKYNCAYLLPLVCDQAFLKHIISSELSDSERAVLTSLVYSEEHLCPFAVAQIKIALEKTADPKEVKTNLVSPAF